MLGVSDLKRSGIKWKVDHVQLRRSRAALKVAGKKYRENMKVNREKKAEHERLGITECELRISRFCTPSNYLTWSHSRKRRFMGKWGSDERAERMRESVLACQNCHRIADEEMSHDESLALHQEIISRRQAA